MKAKVQVIDVWPSLAAAGIILICIIYAFSSSGQTKLQKSVQCKAITKKGAQCQLKTLAVDSICHIHRKGASK